MANINGQVEGTRFATDVSIYDPADGEIITSMTALLAGGFSPAADVADATDEADAVVQLNALLASLRSAGILE